MIYKASVNAVNALIKVARKGIKMSKKKDCSCGKHKKGHHEEMSHSEKVVHLKECLGDVIDRLECIKEMVEKLPLETE
jgi:hypothetical protein